MRIDSTDRSVPSAAPVAWFGYRSRLGGIFIQWIGADSDAQVDDAVRSGKLLPYLTHENAEDLAFSTGASGRLRLMDSSDIDSDPMYPALSIDLRPGSYRLRAGYFETDRLTLIVRALAFEA